MNIECPQCGTKYRLPDDKFRVDAKFRCSVCKTVFALKTSAPQQSSESDAHLAPFSSAEPNVSFSALSLDTSEPVTAAKEYASDEISMASAQCQPAKSDGIAVSQGTGNTAETEKLVIEEHTQRSGKGFVVSLVLLCLCLAGIYWAWVHTSYLDGIKPWVYENAPEQLFEYLPQLKKTEDKPVPTYHLLELKDVRQYQVKNVNSGMLLVIEGKVKNNFTEPCEMIQIEATLYDKNGKELLSKRQVAGAFASPLQLEQLNEAELDSLINNKVSIINHNFNVRYGDEVPFTIVFSKVPEDATDYKVRIIDASVVNTKGNLEQ